MKAHNITTKFWEALKPHRGALSEMPAVHPQRISATPSARSVLPEPSGCPPGVRERTTTLAPSEGPEEKGWLSQGDQGRAASKQLVAQFPLWHYGQPRPRHSARKSHPPAASLAEVLHPAPPQQEPHTSPWPQGGCQGFEPTHAGGWARSPPRVRRAAGAWSCSPPRRGRGAARTNRSRRCHQGWVHYVREKRDVYLSVAKSPSFLVPGDPERSRLCIAMATCYDERDLLCSARGHGS